MKNILVVHPLVEKTHILQKCLNHDTILIQNEYELIHSVKKNTKHIGFVYHNNISSYFPFFKNNHTKESKQFFSDDFHTFLSMISQMNTSIIIDLITCNIDDEDVIKEIMDTMKIYKFKFQIRYSLDQTGNAYRGGDWIMESHDVNVKSIYFTNEICEWNVILQFSEHFGFIDRYNNIHLCGNNSHNQLGSADTTIDYNIIYAREFEEKNKIPIRVECGGNHTIVLFSDGTVGGCGSNVFGQLGLEEPFSDNSFSNYSTIHDIPIKEFQEWPTNSQIIVPPISNIEPRNSRVPVVVNSLAVSDFDTIFLTRNTQLTDRENVDDFPNTNLFLTGKRLTTNQLRNICSPPVNGNQIQFKSVRMSNNLIGGIREDGKIEINSLHISNTIHEHRLGFPQIRIGEITIEERNFFLLRSSRAGLMGGSRRGNTITQSTDISNIIQLDIGDTFFVSIDEHNKLLIGLSISFSPLINSIIIGGRVTTPFGLNIVTEEDMNNPNTPNFDEFKQNLTKGCIQMLDIVEGIDVYNTNQQIRVIFPTTLTQEQNRTYHQVACGREHAVYIYSEKDNPKRRIQGIGRNGFSQMGIAGEHWHGELVDINFSFDISDGDITISNEHIDVQQVACGPFSTFVYLTYEHDSGLSGHRYFIFGNKVDLIENEIEDDDDNDYEYSIRSDNTIEILSIMNTSFMNYKHINDSTPIAYITQDHKLIEFNSDTQMFHERNIDDDNFGSSTRLAIVDISENRLQIANDTYNQLFDLSDNILQGDLNLNENITGGKLTQDQFKELNDFIKMNHHMWHLTGNEFFYDIARQLEVPIENINVSGSRGDNEDSIILNITVEHKEHNNNIAQGDRFQDISFVFHQSDYTFDISGDISNVTFEIQNPLDIIRGSIYTIIKYNLRIDPFDINGNKIIAFDIHGNKINTEKNDNLLNIHWEKGLNTHDKITGIGNRRLGSQIFDNISLNKSMFSDDTSGIRVEIEIIPIKRTSLSVLLRIMQLWNNLNVLRTRSGNRSLCLQNFTHQTAAIFPWISFSINNTGLTPNRWNAGQRLNLRNIINWLTGDESNGQERARFVGEEYRNDNSWRAALIASWSWVNFNERDTPARFTRVANNNQLDVPINIRHIMGPINAASLTLNSYNNSENSYVNSDAIRAIDLWANVRPVDLTHNLEMSWARHHNIHRFFEGRPNTTNGNRRDNDRGRNELNRIQTENRNQLNTRNRLHKNVRNFIRPKHDYRNLHVSFTGEKEILNFDTFIKKMQERLRSYDDRNRIPFYELWLLFQVFENEFNTVPRDNGGLNGRFLQGQGNRSIDDANAINNTRTAFVESLSRTNNTGIFDNIVQQEAEKGYGNITRKLVLNFFQNEKLSTVKLNIPRQNDIISLNSFVGEIDFNDQEKHINFSYIDTYGQLYQTDVNLDTLGVNNGNLTIDLCHNIIGSGYISNSTGRNHFVTLDNNGVAKIRYYLNRQDAIPEFRQIPGDHGDTVSVNNLSYSESGVHAVSCGSNHTSMLMEDGYVKIFGLAESWNREMITLETNRISGFPRIRSIETTNSEIFLKDWYLNNVTSWGNQDYGGFTNYTFQNLGDVELRKSKNNSNNSDNQGKGQKLFSMGPIISNGFAFASIQFKHTNILDDIDEDDDRLGNTTIKSWGKNIPLRVYNIDVRRIFGTKALIDVSNNGFVFSDAFNNASSEYSAFLGIHNSVGDDDSSIVLWGEGILPFLRFGENSLNQSIPNDFMETNTKLGNVYSDGENNTTDNDENDGNDTINDDNINIIIDEDQPLVIDDEEIIDTRQNFHSVESTHHSFSIRTYTMCVFLFDMAGISFYKEYDEYPYFVVYVYVDGESTDVSLNHGFYTTPSENDKLYNLKIVRMYSNDHFYLGIGNDEDETLYIWKYNIAIPVKNINSENKRVLNIHSISRLFIIEYFDHTFEMISMLYPDDIVTPINARDMENMFFVNQFDNSSAFVSGAESEFRIDRVELFHETIMLFDFNRDISNILIFERFKPDDNSNNIPIIFTSEQNIENIIHITSGIDSNNNYEYHFTRLTDNDASREFLRLNINNKSSGLSKSDITVGSIDLNDGNINNVFGIEISLIPFVDPILNMRMP